MVFPVLFDTGYGYYDEIAVIDEDILNDPKFADLIDDDVRKRNEDRKKMDDVFMYKFGWSAFKESMLLSLIIVVIVLAIWYFNANKYIGSFVDFMKADGFNGVLGTTVVIFGTIVVGIAGIYDGLNVWFYRDYFKELFNAQYKILLENELNNKNPATKKYPLQIHTDAYNMTVREARWEEVKKPQFGEEFPFFMKGLFAMFATGAAMEVVIRKNGGEGFTSGLF